MRACVLETRIMSSAAYNFDLLVGSYIALYTTLPHSLIKDKLVDLIEKNFPKGRLSLYSM